LQALDDAFVLSEQQGIAKKALEQIETYRAEHPEEALLRLHLANVESQQGALDDADRNIYGALAQPLNEQERTYAFMLLRENNNARRQKTGMASFVELVKNGGNLRNYLQRSDLPPPLELLKRSMTFDQEHPDHYASLFDHLEETAYHLTDKSLELRMAGLLHDIGKMATKMTIGGRTVFRDHPKVGAKIVREMFYDVEGIDKDLIATTIQQHMPNYTPAWSDKAVRRYVTRCEPYLEETLDLLKADTLARPEPGDLRWFDDLHRLLFAEKARSEYHLFSERR